MHRDKGYENQYLDKPTNTFLACLEEKGEISKSTSKQIKSHISILKYSYIISSRGKDWLNEVIMLSIGALASALISNFANSIFFTMFNFVIGIIFIILILIRAIRR